MGQWIIKIIVEKIIDYVLSLISKERAAQRREEIQKKKDEELAKKVDTAVDEKDEVKKAEDALNG